MALTINAPLLMRNTQAGPTVFFDEDSKTDVTWQGKGDPMGRDVQPVPAKYLENVNFMRVLNSGILALEESGPEARQAIESQLSSPALQHQAKVWAAEKEMTHSATVETIEHKQNLDYVSVPCIGPSTRGSGQCGEPVAVRDTAKMDAPALCQAHIQLEGQYVMSESDRVIDGHAEKIWKRVGIDAKQQHHSTQVHQ